MNHNCIQDGCDGYTCQNKLFLMRSSCYGIFAKTLRKCILNHCFTVSHWFNSFTYHCLHETWGPLVYFVYTNWSCRNLREVYHTYITDLSINCQNGFCSAIDSSIENDSLDSFQYSQFQFSTKTQIILKTGINLGTFYPEREDKPTEFVKLYIRGAYSFKSR